MWKSIRRNLMSPIKKILIGFLIVFVGVQFIPTERNQSNLILDSDISKIYSIPHSVQEILKKSCYDCHSNQTNYPWYNKIQPIAWFLEDHIDDAKRDLNFSEFGAYSDRRKKSKLGSILNQIEKNKMPLDSYTFIHKDAILTKQMKSELTRWINSLGYD